MPVLPHRPHRHQPRRPRPPPPPSPTPPPPPTPPPTPAPLPGLALERVAEGRGQPGDVKARPGDGALFAVERVGVIRRVVAGAEEHPVMLDIRDRVNSFSIEQGLLGFAFHPQYPTDPRVFVYHSLAGNHNVLASYRTTGDPDLLDPESRTQLLVVPKEPERVRHNGGTVLFGPDGLLYLSIGDAELGIANGQVPTSFPATVLRIDVDAGDPYAIPPGNPFAAGGIGPDGVQGAPEVWWFGLRNPWRLSFDAETGLAYIADVGQERAEEINVVPLADGGLNFGWPAWEGLDPFLNVETVSDVVHPVIEIVHDEVDRGCSLTGGEVYRGRAIPELIGHYFYADWCRGWVRSFRYTNGEAADHQDLLALQGIGQAPLARALCCAQ
jgi:glucose/arabinose dehydrogenase